MVVRDVGRNHLLDMGGQMNWQYRNDEDAVIVGIFHRLQNARRKWKRGQLLIMLIEKALG